MYVIGKLTLFWKNNLLFLCFFINKSMSNFFSSYAIIEFLAN